MSSLTRTMPLFRLNLRTCWGSLLAWIVFGSLLAATSPRAFAAVDTEEARQMIASIMGDNVVMLFLLGKMYDIATLDGFVVWRSLAFGSIFVAVGSTLIVSRTLKRPEESGLAELIDAAVVGRHARLAASFLTGLMIGVGTAIVSAVTTMAEGVSAAAAVALGLTYLLTSLLWSALTALLSQMFTESQGATRLSLSIFAILFCARGAVYAFDLPEWLAWINPLGTIGMTDPPGPIRYYPALIVAVLSVSLIAMAWILTLRRDVGSGIFPAQSGPAQGSTGTVAGLATHLYRATMLSWGSTVVVFALIFAGLTDTFVRMTADTSLLELVASGSQEDLTPTEIYLALMLNLIGLLSAAAALGALGIMRREENEGRAALILSRPVSRASWFGSHVGAAYVMSSTLVLAGTAALTMAIKSFGTEGTSASVTGLQGVLVLFPVWALVSVGVALSSALPRFQALAWLPFAASAYITVLGPMSHFSESTMNWSIFTHVPTAASGVTLTAPAAMLAFAALGTAIGFVGFRRREVVG